MSDATTGKPRRKGVLRRLLYGLYGPPQLGPYPSDQPRVATETTTERERLDER